MVFLAQVAGRLSQHLLEAMAGALLDLWLQLCCTFFDHLPVTHHRRRSSEIPEVIQLLPLLTVQILEILLGNELPNSAPLKILAQVIYWLYEYINCRGKRTTHKDGGAEVLPMDKRTLSVPEFCCQGVSDSRV